MSSINTFSAAVNLAIQRSGRPDKLSDIIGFVRQTIRELQVVDGAIFMKDLVEDTFTASTDPYVWTYPNTFRKMYSVQYPDLVSENGRPVRPRFVQGPGRALDENTWAYYASGDSFVFVGHDGGTIDVAYVTYIKPLVYYSTNAPADFSLEDYTWSYLTAVTDQEKADAQALVSNWVLFNWFESVVEGCLAKLYKLYGDERAVSSFALYKSYQKDMKSAEMLLSVAGEV